ncbi:MAG: TerD family protein [Pseudomonadales bacterium]|uniref:TerD family stress response protein n=1 Tax=Oleiphilus messinensis TaxID=141451 RepID=A0A1Y0I585_9GAMM|nr:TerD family protein [Oleiphilus messinensis]ARU54695.1 TerD family stress response protein [Oleiphilus messinensis]MCG8609846.1 TerD family protein [Pseudomonadales bacterium]
MTISLEKGQRISLEKGGNKLDRVCVGVNWGAIEKKGFFGTKKVAVDLDASVGLYNDQKQPVDVVYFGQLKSQDGSIRHSGDDLTGDMDGDDGLDNEIITIELNAVPQSVQQVAVVLNSFRGHDFGTIPFASVRLYEGTPTRVDSVLASYNIANDAKFHGSVSMVLGILYRHNSEWKFRAVGEPTQDKKLPETIQTVAQSYL